MRLIIAAILLWLSATVLSAYTPQLDTAKRYVGVVERGGNNRGPEVELFLRSVGLGPGYPWCAAFVSHVLTQCGEAIEWPEKRTAGARAFISNKAIKATSVLRGAKTIEPGWLVIWKRGNSWAGHVGFVREWGKRYGKTIEGNTSSGSGSQRDGDGVYMRSRSIQPGNYFRITHFEPVITKAIRRPEPTYVPVWPMNIGSFQLRH